jgi:hypothetical protein
MGTIDLPTLDALSPLASSRTGGRYRRVTMHDLSDEDLCARWVENPYYQLFCDGMDGPGTMLALYGLTRFLAAHLECDSAKGRRAFGYHQGQQSDQAAPKAGYTIASDPSVRPYTARSSSGTTWPSTVRR